MENYILDFNPIAFSIGPINVYWYGLAYMAGMILGVFYLCNTGLMVMEHAPFTLRMHEDISSSYW